MGHQVVVAGRLGADPEFLEMGGRDRQFWKEGLGKVIHAPKPLFSKVVKEKGGGVVPSPKICPWLAGVTDTKSLNNVLGDNFTIK